MNDDNQRQTPQKRRQERRQRQAQPAEEEYEQPSSEKVEKVRIMMQIMSQCGVWMADEALSALFRSIVAAVPKDISMEWHVLPMLDDEMSELTEEVATIPQPATHKGEENSL